jgi:hypothetical protein
MIRLSLLAAIGAVALLTACSGTNVPASQLAGAAADQQLALNECRERADVEGNPSVGQGMVGAVDHNRAVDQCLRDMSKPNY